MSSHSAAKLQSGPSVAIARGWEALCKGQVQEALALFDAVVAAEGPGFAPKLWQRGIGEVHGRDNLCPARGVALCGRWRLNGPAEEQLAHPSLGTRIPKGTTSRGNFTRGGSSLRQTLPSTPMMSKSTRGSVHAR